MNELADVVDLRPLKDFARSRLSNGSALREYILTLDDEVSKYEYLMIVKQSMRLMHSGPI